MGAHVWKRENGSASSQPSERQSVPEGSASAVVSDNSTETADVRNPPHKKQRVEPSPATADRINGSLASNGGVSVAATASAAAGAMVNDPGDGSGNFRTQGPGQQHQRGRHPGRGPGRGASLTRGRGRRFAERNRGSSPGASLAATQHTTRGTTSAAGGRGSDFGHSSAVARGAGRSGYQQLSGRDRGAASGFGSTHSNQHHQQQQQQQQQQSSAAAAAADEALLAKEQELAALKAKIAQQQAKKDALNAAQQLREQQQQQQQELQQRKNRLNSGFGSAFANAAKARHEQPAVQHAAGIGAEDAPPNSSYSLEADEAEVQRVLSSKNDYDALQLKPGCDKTALKKRYREMAVRLHPDKCKAADASVAFQRAHKAYLTLQAHVL